MANRKKYTHKQSKYFTIMLVPSSSSKMFSLRIPHWFLYVAFGTCTFFVLVSIIFSLKNQELQRVVGDFSTHLEETLQINEELYQDKEKLSEEMEAEKTRLEELIEKEKLQASTDMQRQKEDYIDSLDYYEDRILDFEAQIEAIEKAKKEIYDKLSKIELPNAVANRLIALTDNSEKNITRLNMAFYNEETFSDLDDRVASLSARLQTEMQEFQNLITNVEIITPYLESVPNIWPARGRVTSEMGSRPNPFNNRGIEAHTGLDIAVPTGTDVKSTAAGKVIFAGWDGGYGYTVRIDHGYGITTVYAHNSRLLVKIGDSVGRGEVIARSGNTGRSTGPHIHYEVLLNGVYQNPRKYLP